MNAGVVRCWQLVPRVTLINYRLDYWGISVGWWTWKQEWKLNTAWNARLSKYRDSKSEQIKAERETAERPKK